MNRIRKGDLVEVVEAIEEQMLEIVGEPAHSFRFVLRTRRYSNSHQNRSRTGARPQDRLRPRRQGPLYRAIDHHLGSWCGR